MTIANFTAVSYCCEVRNCHKSLTWFLPFLPWFSVVPNDNPCRQVLRGWTAHDAPVDLQPAHRVEIAKSFSKVCALTSERIQFMIRLALSTVGIFNRNFLMISFQWLVWELAVDEPGFTECRSVVLTTEPRLLFSCAWKNGIEYIYYILCYQKVVR